MSVNVINVLYWMIQIFSSSSAYFDAGQFLNITDNESLDLYKDYHMCLGQNVKDICCSCEAYCMETKTCCIDAFWNSTYISRQEKYVKDFLALSKQRKDPECMPLFSKYLFDGRIPSYYMVTSCQGSTSLVSNELKEKCIMGSKTGNSIDYYIPVKGNDDNLYRNKYCAICNSVSEFEMVQIDKGCIFGICQLRLFQHDKKLCNYGNKRLNKTCSRKNRFYDLCRSFTGPMGQYANYFCHLCNHGYPSVKIIPAKCLGEFKTRPKSWASLLKFAFTDKVNSKCTNGRIMKEKNQCITFLCPDGYKARNSKCVSIKGWTDRRLSIKEASFDNCLFASNPNIFMKNTRRIQDVLRELFGTYKNYLRNVSVRNFDRLYFIDGDLSQNFSINFAALNTKKIMGMLDENGSVFFTQAKLYSLVNSKMNMKQIFPRNMICAYPVPVLSKSLHFTQNCNAMVRKKLIPFSNLSLHIIIDKNGLTREAYSCNQFHLSKPCPRKVLSRNDSFRNGTKLQYKKDGVSRIYELNEYAPYKDGGYTVCIEKVNDSSAPQWLLTIDEVSGYLSIVGSSLSVFCYVLLIVIILQNKELRTVPGLCTLALSINLLIGDGLFLTTNFMHVSEKYKSMTSLCDIIGISIHFFLLSAQMWGVVMAVDVSMNLPKMNLLRQSSKQKFVWYNAIPIFFAGTLVIIALLFRTYDIIDVRYHEGDFCVLHGFYSRIFLYFLPLLVCFFVSSIALTISLRYIAKEREKNESILKGSNKNNTNVIHVGLRLVILCGLTEGIGIVYIPTKTDSAEGIFIVNSIFMVLYSLMKGFRGVMIFFVYACRRQVYDIYKRRYGKKDIRNKDVISDGTATTRI